MMVWGCTIRHSHDGGGVVAGGGLRGWLSYAANERILSWVIFHKSCESFKEEVSTHMLEREARYAMIKKAFKSDTAEEEEEDVMKWLM